MKTVKTCIISLTLFCSAMCAEAAAQNWYVINIYDIESDRGSVIQMRVATRTPDEDVCYAMVGRPWKLEVGELKCVNSDCFTGLEFDHALQPVFDGTPQEEPYIIIIDAEGLESVIDFLDVPRGDIVPLTEGVAKELGKYIPVVNVIYSAAYKPYVEEGAQAGATTEADVFGTGSGMDEVTRIQGEPDSKAGNIWFYGYDFLIFDADGKVKEIRDFSGTLKAKKKKISISRLIPGVESQDGDNEEADRAMIGLLSRSELGEEEIKELVAEFESLGIGVPDISSGTAMSYDKELIKKAAAIGRIAHNMTLALPDTAFAEYGRLVSLIDEVLALDTDEMRKVMDGKGYDSRYWRTLRDSIMKEITSEKAQVFGVR
ncbi:MAG: hypothetical protein PHH49_05745 [Candidatus Omnitrophica bacterium]|nr:hypothetical protein [Candidatus Omnitrophota bacterium]MDD5488446.1 hypothetical protein [Candidatus Omnitrophota bacterium]